MPQGIRALWRWALTELSVSQRLLFFSFVSFSFWQELLSSFLLEGIYTDLLKNNALRGQDTDVNFLPFGLTLFTIT